PTRTSRLLRTDNPNPNYISHAYTGCSSSRSPDITCDRVGASSPPKRRSPMPAQPRPLMNRFEGKVAIVTGAGSGMGRATALRLAAEGAAVGVADIVDASARAVVEEIADQGGRALPLIADVSDEAAVAEMVAATVRDLGRLDVLHNNAALVAQDVLARDLEIG